MAKKVNTKFLIILSAVLIVGVVGVAGMLAFVLGRTGDQLMSRGDAALARGDFKEAALNYSKAVNKNPTNPGWIIKWRDALLQTTPPTDSEYEFKYNNDYLGALRQLATLLQTDTEAYEDYLGTMAHNMNLGGFNRGSYDYLQAETEVALTAFEALPPGGDSGPAEGWRRLYRYRGMAAARIFMNQPDQLTPEQQIKALADLDKALAADPTDFESAINKHLVLFGQAELARRQQREPEVEPLMRASRGVLEEFNRSHPGEPRIEALLLVHDINELRYRIADEYRGADATSVFRAELEKFKPRLDALSASIRAADQSKVDILVHSQFEALERSVDPTSRGTRIEEILRARLAQNPHDHLAIYQLATILASRLDYRSAIDEMEKIAALPRPPLSFDGLILADRKIMSRGMQADYMLMMWERSTDPGEKASLLEQSRKYRDEFAAIAPSGSPGVLLINAKLAYAENDIPAANRFLTQYNEATRDMSVDALWLQMQLRLRAQDSGEAERLANRILELQPANLSALLAKADIRVRLLDYPEAQRLYELIISIDPQNQAAKARLASLNALIRGGTVEDPVSQALIDAERAAVDDRHNDAIQILMAAAEANDFNPRLVRPLAQNLVAFARRDEAIQLVRKAIALHPNDRALGGILIALEEADTVRASLRIIDAADASPLDKELQRFVVYRNAGMKDETAASLEELRSLGQDDSRVVEMLFIDAISNARFEEAGRLADTAQARDLDRCGGRTFRARLLAAQGRLNEAIVMLQQAADSGALGAEVYRLLGRMQLQAGRSADGVATFRKALDFRPDDASLVTEFVSVLMNLGRAEEALEEARRRERFGRSDPSFNQLFLALEGSVGDKEKALKMRETMLERGNQSVENRAAIAMLRIELKQFDAARSLIADLRRENPDDANLVLLQARWHADQADFDRARGAFVEFIVNIPRAKLNTEPYLLYADFLRQINFHDSVITTLQQARRLQEPGIMEADRMLADAYALYSRHDLAEPVYRRVIDGNADTRDKTFHKRLIECLLRLRKFDEAQREVDAISGLYESDPVVRILTAEVAKGRGDMRRSREVIDRAKTVFPNDPRVWIKSAQLLSDQPGADTDILADLNRAKVLNPGSAQVHQLLGQYYFRRGMIDEALRELREAVRLNPRLDDLRYILVRELVAQGREGDAADVVDEILRIRTNDIQLMARYGLVFAENRKWRHAARYFRTAWELSRSPTLVKWYLDCLLSDTNPSLSEAENVLRQLQDRIEREPELLMSRARVLALRGRTDDAQRDALSALAFVGANPEFGYFDWFGVFSTMYPRGADRIRVLESFARDNRQAGHHEWFNFFRALTLLENKATESDALAQISQLAAQTSDRDLKQACYRRTTVGLYMAERYEDAVEEMRRSVRDFPDDWEFANNLAFALTTHLNRPVEALPHAERAVLRNPKSSDAFDTLGVTYLRLGELDKAEVALLDALDLADRVRQRGPVLLHLAELLVLKGDHDSARKHLADLDILLKADPNMFTNVQQTELARIRDKVRSN